MNAQKKVRTAQAAVPKMTRDELRRRILVIVNERQHTSEAEIWRADSPNYLPWDSMVEEIHTLDRQKKLRREVVAPGHILIHSITAPPVPANPPTAATEATPASSMPKAKAATKTPAKAARPSARASKQQQTKRKTKAAK